MLWNDDQVDHTQLLAVIVQQKETGIVARCQSIALCPERAVKNFGPENALLTLKFEFLLAGCAEEIGNRTVIRKRVDFGDTAIGTIHLIADPTLGP